LYLWSKVHYIDPDFDTPVSLQVILDTPNSRYFHYLRAKQRHDLTRGPIFQVERRR